MALNERRSWIIAYDIAQPRRLGRVYRYLKGVAVPVQYSLYFAVETASGIRRIRDEIASRIDPRADDVRIYQLPQQPCVLRFGKRALPEGLIVAQADLAQGAWTLLGADGGDASGNDGNV